MKVSVVTITDEHENHIVRVFSEDAKADDFIDDYIYEKGVHWHWNTVLADNEGETMRQFGSCKLSQWLYIVLHKYRLDVI